MSSAEPIRLSSVAKAPPEDGKLVATNKNIERLDLVRWDPACVKAVKLEFNKIEYLMGLGQFRELVYLDLSNNNVGAAQQICALSDLRLLSRHKKLEFVDLSNNPIVHHSYYREFLSLFVENVKTIDRAPVEPAFLSEIKHRTSGIKDVLTTVLIKFLKILAVKSIAARLRVNQELLRRFGAHSDEPPRGQRVYELLERNIVEGFEDAALIEFEAYILDDLELLMDSFFADKPFARVTQIRRSLEPRLQRVRLAAGREVPRDHHRPPRCRRRPHQPRAARRRKEQVLPRRPGAARAPRLQPLEQRPAARHACDQKTPARSRPRRERLQAVRRAPGGALRHRGVRQTLQFRAPQELPEPRRPRGFGRQEYHEVPRSDAGGATRRAWSRR